MSLLAPLYIAALAALSVPLVLHLIRRTPRGRQAFSSLMFLSPSPPRLTKRSRIDHWLLLLLRAAALALLALAFARPFLRRFEQLDLGAGSQKRTAIVLDTSASMRRDGVWEEAMAKANAVLSKAGPDDGVALITFAESPTWLLTFDETAQTPPGGRKALAASRLKQARPTWGAGDLGAALVDAADSLDSLDAQRKGDKPSDERLEIVVISDLPEGAQLAALEAYEWPQRVRVAVEQVGGLTRGNAGLHLALGDDLTDEHAPSEKKPSPEAATARKRKEIVRVRVTSAADSDREKFALHWASSRGVAEKPAAQVHVPAGESRVVKLARPGAAFDRLMLKGDGQKFDNRVFLPRSTPASGARYYFGDDKADDAASLLYYLERAVAEEDSGEAAKLEVNPTALPAPRPGDASPPFLVIGGLLSGERIAQAQKFLAAGGSALLVAGDVPTAEMLPQLAGLPDATNPEFAREAEVAKYALLGEIDFSDPLFAPFADPRYGDFTGIHFWRYRKIQPSPAAGEVAGQMHVLARFDNGDPALVEHRVGEGRLWTLLSSWRPRDSELARSSKFVPLLWGMLTAGESADARRTAFRVNESVLLGSGVASVRTPSGETVKLPEGAQAFDKTDTPGIYRMTGLPGGDAANREFAVNLAAEESRTAPMPVDQLESRGVQLTGAKIEARLAEQKRQLLDMELEGRQQVWRWLIGAALAVLLLEIVVAGRTARLASRPASPEAA